MKQEGNCIIGDPVQLDSYTSAWSSVKLHPTVYYRHFDDFAKGYKHVKGLYTEIDMGTIIVIRFSEKDDMTNFHRRHNQYI